VGDYVAATKNEGSTSVARFIHPDELARFRAGVEPGIRLGLADKRMRAAFLSFADPHNPHSLRAFASDAEFLAVFIAWISRQNTQAPQLFKDAEVTTIGHVDEGEMCHVVIRIRIARGKPEEDQTTIISTKLFHGEPMLMLTPDLERMMLPFTPRH